MAGDRTLVVGVYGHSGCGKTTLVEALLQAAGLLTRRGKVEEGPQFLDREPESQKHHMSVQMNLASLEAGGRPVTFVDTPGYPDFVADALAADRAVDAAVVVLDATQGLQVGAEAHVRRLRRLGLPMLLVVTKMDREHADFARALSEARAAGLPAEAFYRPDGEAAAFRAVHRERWDEPPLVERLVEADDRLLERYLEGGELGEAELAQALAQSLAAGTVVPALPVSGVSGAGVPELLDLLARLPVREAGDGGPLVEVVKVVYDPAAGRLALVKVHRGVLRADAALQNHRTGRSERLGQMFRIQGGQREPVGELGAGSIGAVAKMAEVLRGDWLTEPGADPPSAVLELPPPYHRMAIRPVASGDDDRLSNALQRQLEEDPGLRLERGRRELVVAGYGDLHLEVLKERLARKFHVDVVFSPPEVPYLETIRVPAKAEGKHKKQTGGHGQYGHVWIEIAPSEKEFEFVDKIFGGAVPIQYRPSVEKGVRMAMEEGVLAGYPMTRIRCVLYDGSSHPVDSSELAFQLAGILAFKKAAKEAKPVLLEPIDLVEVRVPAGHAGDVMGDLTRRRGRILGLENDGAEEVVRAEVPEAELARYAVELRALTAGRAVHRQEFVRYEEVPQPIAEEIVARRQAG